MSETGITAAAVKRVRVATTIVWLILAGMTTLCWAGVTSANPVTLGYALFMATTDLPAPDGFARYLLGASWLLPGAIINSMAQERLGILKAGSREAYLAKIPEYLGVLVRVSPSHEGWLIETSVGFYRARGQVSGLKKGSRVHRLQDKLVIRNSHGCDRELEIIPEQSTDQRQACAAD